MGCNKINKDFYRKKADHIKVPLIVSLVITMVITAITPVAIASHEADINVTFDPEGDIDIAVSPTTATWVATPIPLNTTDNDPDEGAGTGVYTITNSGSVAAHIWVHANTTSDGGDWTLDNDGSWAVDADDTFAIQINNQTAGSQWITNTNASWIANLPDQNSDKFGLQMDISSASGADVMDQQEHWINITGTIFQ